MKEKEQFIEKTDDTRTARKTPPSALKAKGRLSFGAEDGTQNRAEEISPADTQSEKGANLLPDCADESDSAGSAAENTAEDAAVSGSGFFSYFKTAVLSIIAATALAAAALGAWLFLPYTYLGGELVSTKETTLRLSGEVPSLVMLSRMSKLETLDLRGMAIGDEELSSIKSTLPDCEVIYDVRVGDKLLSSNAESLTLEDIGAENLSSLAENLSYFTKLKSLDIREANAEPAVYDRIIENIGEKTSLLWSVPLGDSFIDSDTESLNLKDYGKSLSSDSLFSALSYLKKLRALDFAWFAVDFSAVRFMESNLPDCEFTVRHAVIGNTVFDVTMKSAEIGQNEETDGITDISMLKYMTALQSLTIRNQNKIADFEAFNSLPKIESVTLENSLINLDSLSYLKGMKKLYLLKIPSKFSLEPLAKCGKLEYLYINEAEITDVAPLQKCGKLRTLYIFNTKVRDIDPLAQCKGIKEIHLGYNNADVVDVARLQARTRAKVIYYY
ncbi:MAG: hypothetical protein LBL82_06385 [Oscillospiraceae bacterium]|jgi:hypothetical protein|nr:hypothetical protein [Oscillospiraceae bacterium]